MRAGLRFGLTLAAFVAASAAPLSPAAAAPTATKHRTPSPTPGTSLSGDPATATYPIERNGSTLDLEYCANGRVDGRNTAVRAVVVVVHGNQRNACDYSSYMVDAAQRHGTLDRTLVVAPHFLADSDVSSSNTRTLYWSSSGWKDGSQSRTSPARRPWTISSFEALDQLITGIADRARFPNLSRLVVAGHSAGGQFTNRYAAGTRLTAAATPGVARSFVVANPSSYLYFNAHRPKGGELRSLTSSDVSAFREYDDYKYGLRQLNSYMSARGVENLRRQYAARHVTYLLGERDTSTTESSLDKTCPARWQGAHRLERGTNYYKHVGATFGSSVYQRHRKVLVPDVGHDGHAMFTSSAGRSVLFGSQ